MTCFRVLFDLLFRFVSHFVSPRFVSCLVLFPPPIFVSCFGRLIIWYVSYVVSLFFSCDPDSWLRHALALIALVLYLLQSLSRALP